MEERIVKFLLLALLTAHFVTLLSDGVGPTDSLMSRAVVGVTISLAAGLVFGGLQERPNLSMLVFFAFWEWPVSLLIAKAVSPSIS